MPTFSPAADGTSPVPDAAMFILVSGVATPVSSANPVPVSGSFSSASGGTLNTTAPTVGDQVAGQDGTGKLQAITAAVFHNSDGQTIATTANGLLTGGVAQLLNAAGTLDRQRSANSDAMAVTGLTAGGGMLWNGTTWDRNRSATGDALANTGITAGGTMSFNGTTWDRARSVSADAVASTGVQAATDLIFNGTTYDRPRGVTGDGQAATGIPAEAMMMWNGTTYDRAPGAAATGLKVNAANVTGTVAVGTAAGNSLLAGSVYNTTVPAPTNGQQMALQADATGALRVQDRYTSAVQVTPATTAVTYTAGQTMGGLLTFAAVARVSSGTIQAINVGVNSGASGAMTVVFFNATPSSSTYTNAATFVLAAADLGKVIGVELISTFVAAGTPKFGLLTNLQLPFKLPSGTTLYAVLIAGASITIASTTDMVATVTVQQD